MLNRRRRRTERSIGMDRQRRNAAVAVVRDEDAPARGIHRKVGWTETGAGLLVDLRQGSGLVVDEKRIHGAVRQAANGAVRIQKMVIRVDRKERGVRSFDGQGGRGQRAGGAVETANVDAFAFPACVGAEVNEIVVGQRWHGGSFHTCRKSAGEFDGEEETDNQKLESMNHRTRR